MMGLGKPVAPALNMTIFGIYVKFLGGKQLKGFYQEGFEDLIDPETQKPGFMWTVTKTAQATIRLGSAYLDMAS